MKSNNKKKSNNKRLAEIFGTHAVHAALQNPSRKHEKLFIFFVFVYLWYHFQLFGNWPSATLCEAHSGCKGVWGLRGDARSTIKTMVFALGDA